ncbi:uncharacterized protein LY89DRAFT_648327 [Mollisia scopiformis]|uniref:Uncharacterized protein n=1 Tax=Mollisia scopiformis TaxID=149040 RepID=A0A194X4P9_MOLSC|nr:uncharacterized protein LY89DRAFT_648327 [Mollisia scopiformis]KUJ15150.1 hypothetical protein LY89DRAFT_648327 [Mollisia scopiformis]
MPHLSPVVLCPHVAWRGVASTPRYSTVSHRISFDGGGRILHPSADTVWLLSHPTTIYSNHRLDGINPRPMQQRPLHPHPHPYPHPVDSWPHLTSLSLRHAVK